MPFFFKSKDEEDWVLQRYWIMLGVPVMLKKWNPMFDVEKEKKDWEPVWVWIP